MGPRFLVEMLLYANDPEVIAPARGVGSEQSWCSWSWLRRAHPSSGKSSVVDGSQSGSELPLTAISLRWGSLSAEQGGLDWRVAVEF